MCRKLCARGIIQVVFGRMDMILTDIWAEGKFKVEQATWELIVTWFNRLEHIFKIIGSAGHDYRAPKLICLKKYVLDSILGVF